MNIAKKLLRRLAETNYHSAKWLWKRTQRQSLYSRSGEPILNYQMGKVGSSTVQASLEKLSLDHPVYHVHFLNPERVGEIERQRRKYFNTDRYGLLRRPWLYEFLYEEIRSKRHHWKLISLVREPIARNVSTFFENLDVTEKVPGKRYVVRSDYYGIDIVVDIDNLDELIGLFFERLVHERPLRYFDDEIEAVFGIDIFEYQFPRDAGYRIYRTDNADLLLIRLEDLDRCAAKAFSEFLGIDGFSLVQTNVASDKVYAPLYTAFKNGIRFPDDYIARMYDSRYARYFYSDAEIGVFRGKWSKGR